LKMFACFLLALREFFTTNGYRV